MITRLLNSENETSHQETSAHMIIQKLPKCLINSLLNQEKLIIQITRTYFLVFDFKRTKLYISINIFHIWSQTKTMECDSHLVFDSSLLILSNFSRVKKSKVNRAENDLP